MEFEHITIGIINKQTDFNNGRANNNLMFQTVESQQKL